MYWRRASTNDGLLRRKRADVNVGQWIVILYVRSFCVNRIVVDVP